jgi:nucleotide-binding universal stress UspA family protein
VRIRNILVPTDFSDHSGVAVDYGIQMAKALASKIHFLHAYYVAMPLLTDVPYVLPESVLEKIRKDAGERLAALSRRASQEGVPCETHLSPIHPTAALLELAGSLPADLIVMGTHGFTGLKHVALGSVAERAVRLAPCPVMTVKKDDR